MTDALGNNERTQVVGKRFALLGETRLCEFQKRGDIRKLEISVFTGETQRDERGGDFRRRSESARRKAQVEIRAGVELSGNGEVAILLAAGAGSEASGDFELNQNVGFVDAIGKLEEMMKDWGSDVVGKIAIEADAAPGGQSSEIDFEDIGGNEGEIGIFVSETLKTGDERRIELDGDDGSATAKEMFGHFTMAGADFDPAVIAGCGLRGRLHAVRGHTNGAGNFFSPAGIAEEVLTKPLSRHGVGLESVTGGGVGALAGNPC